MSTPVQAGDTCRVISGLGRHKSPNLGLTVRVVSLQGEHSQHGRIWHCVGSDVRQLQDNGQYQVTGAADFSVHWLRKIEPPAGILRVLEKGLAT